MYIKSDLFRHLNLELSRKEVKTKLGQAALNQKNNLDVDINQKSFLPKKDPKNQQQEKQKQGQQKEKNKVTSLDPIKAQMPEQTNDDQANAPIKKLNWL